MFILELACKTFTVPVPVAVILAVFILRFACKVFDVTLFRTTKLLENVPLPTTLIVLPNAVGPVTFKLPPIFAVFATVRPVLEPKANMDPCMFA